MARSERFKNNLKFIKGNIPEAINKDGRTLTEILEDIKTEKQIEKDVIKLNDKGQSYLNISRILKIKLSKVKHILKFDALGLSYRKLSEK